MRMALVALLLVVGAGVVLWFGNTLNSLVLGGLIGGLAALLISIPISVTLFFHLSQRHEERLRVQGEEVVSLAQVHGYGNGRGYAYGQEQVEVYEAEPYLLTHEGAWDEEEDDRQYHVQSEQPERYLPVPSQRRLPVQSPAPRRRRGMEQPASGKITPMHRALPAEAEYLPGFPGYQPPSFRSQQQEARRAAHDEAQYGRTGMVRSPSTRKFAAARPTSSFQQPDYEDQPPTRALPRQTTRQNRPRRVIDSTSGLSSGGANSGVHRPLPAAGETTANRSTQRPSTRQDGDLDTESLQGRFSRQQAEPIYPQTGQLRQQTGQLGRIGQLRQQTGQTTGQLRRNPNLEGQRRNPDVVTGSLRNPMVRRAPYMYEDDALREELSQLIDPPTIRRSSRYASQQYQEYEGEE